jgi:NAD(P)-dependent dehydrogenase (short-subunit alcohol dehydrogenase family)
MRLKDKVAVVTGGASGIGAASVERFVNEGCRVVIGDIQAGPGEAFAARFGAAAKFAVCDVTQEDQVEGLVDLAMSHFGHLDIMFNNAGIVGAIGPIDSTQYAEWRASSAWRARQD